jgi:hypothetical protein
MLGGRARIARRRLAACLAGIAIGGIAVARDTPPVAAPSAPSLASATSAAAAPATTLAMPAAGAAAAPAPPVQQLSEAQLDQLVAPIALYPDPLLAQILMASTYPLEVVEAARWVATPANRALTGDALADALAAQNWDPSVRALVAFPEVLENMSDRLQWTQELGNAFLAQQVDVMGAVQRLRRAAMAAGTLRTTQQCDCRVEASGETIAIPPAEPEAVRVPVYTPVVYGPWPDEAYPPDSFPAPEGFAYLPGFWIGFEPPVDLALYGPLWGWCWIDWGHREIGVDRRRHALALAGHAAFTGRVWMHDPAHRGGVRYADRATRARFDTARIAALTAAARFDRAPRLEAARSEPLPGGTSRFAAAAPTLASAPALHGAATPKGVADTHGTSAFRAAAGFRGVPAAHGAVASHVRPTAFRGGQALHGPRHSRPGSRPR